jgi:hypothetical protein
MQSLLTIQSHLLRLVAVDDLSNLLEREIQTTASFLNGLAVYPRIQDGGAGVTPKLATVARETGIQMMGLYLPGNCPRSLKR